MDDSELDSLPHGWITIGKRRWYEVWIAGRWYVLFLLLDMVLYVSFQLGRAIEVSFFVMAPIVFAVVVVTLAIVTVGLNRRWPQPAMNLDTSELRAGSKAVALGDVDSAQLSATSAGRHERVVVLRLSAGRDVRAVFVLRGRNGAPLEATSRLALAEAIRRTSIVMPVSKNDPTGRFAHVNFPGHVTRDEAVSLALNPPARTDPLPIPS